MWKPAPLIWNTQMGEESMSDRKPMILVFAGPNGSGKSTITPYFEIVASRVANGGHDVERSKIIDRYYKSIANIPELLNLCDIMHVYDNTIEPFRIIRKHKDKLSAFSNDLWPEDKIEKLMHE